ncbi:MAG: GTP-binding protein [Paludibacteraceae bacterium]|nr:GTP-binding protein [Paludibacteraceae bacterium]
MDINSIPVLLLTGYLGSGKTTLLNRILANQAGIRFAVIVNDIGEVNVDAALIEKGGVVKEKDDNLLSLSNGCICCTLKMDLVQQLHDLCVAKKFDYIVIEASGICEPAPIAQTICSYRKMVPFTEDPAPRLDCVVSVVDALRLKDEFEMGNELKRNDLEEDDLASLVIQQIEFCNLILLNKADELTRDELNYVKEVIRAIQPTAEIVETNYCDVAFDKILHTHSFRFDDVAGSAAWLQGVEGDIDDLENEEEGEAYEYGIDTFVYYRRKPFKLGLFDDFVARLWPKSVIRCKGMCYFDDEYDMCYLFEQAGKQFNLKQCGEFYATMPKEELMQALASDPMLQRDWDDQYGDRMQKLVFIGQQMDKEAIIKALDACLAY